MKIKEKLRGILKEEYFKLICEDRSEEQIINLFFTDMQDPTIVKTNKNLVTFIWEYEFPSYQTKSNEPKAIGFTWTEEFDTDDNSKIINCPTVI